MPLRPQDPPPAPAPSPVVDNPRAGSFSPEEGPLPSHRTPDTAGKSGGGASTATGLTERKRGRFRSSPIERLLSYQQ